MPLLPNRVQFVFHPLGSAGDVHPYLALSQELLRRGYQVWMISNPIFFRLAERHRVYLLSLGVPRSLKAAGHHPLLHSHRHGWKIALRWAAIRHLRQSYQFLHNCNTLGPTVVVAPSMCLSARLINEVEGCPLVTVHLEPEKFRSVYRSPVMPPPMWLPDYMPKAIKRLQYRIADRYVIDPLLRPLNRFRKELGLDRPVERILDRWWLSPERIIGLFPEWYGPPQPDWPAQTVLTNFPLWDPTPDKPVDAELTAFLARPDKPLVFVPGSAGALCTREFFETAITVSRRLGRRALLLTRINDLVPASLPPGVLHLPYAPLADVLPHAAALVHHGGIGTAAQAMRAGVPQLVCPVAFNQPDDAERMRRLGIAAKLAPSRFRPAAVERKLAYLTGDPAVQAACREIASRFVGRDGIGETCDELERFAEGVTDRRPLIRQELATWAEAAVAEPLPTAASS